MMAIPVVIPFRVELSLYHNAAIHASGVQPSERLGPQVVKIFFDWYDWRVTLQRKQYRIHLDLHQSKRCCCGGVFS
jgi:hypothetical protein